MAGVALKFSMLAKGDRLTLPACGVGGDWIVKLPDQTYPDVPRNEFTMMSRAASAGIAVPPVRLVHRDELDGLPPDVWPSREEWAYAIRRFDRDAHRDSVHIEDLTQVRNVYPEDKYLGNYETVAALAHRGHDLDSLREFARRLVFTILIANGDAHLKNWSLIYTDPRVPSLAPAYDMVSTAYYLGEREMLGLKFGGSRRFERVDVTTFERLQGRLRAPQA
ncbi:MAG: HipA domain-containing protein [Pseudonocardiaceae bacterium]